MEIYNGEKWWEIDSTSPEEQTDGGRGLFGGGCTSPGGSDDRHVNTIDYITIASTGNAQDFGDLTYVTRSGCGLSDSHGGLNH